MTNPTVVLVGRTNVGKSTLFNCLAETRRALVSRSRGTTRDVLTAPIRWRGRQFQLVDTGGLDVGLGTIDRATRERSLVAASRANLAVVVVDGRSGPTAADRATIDALGDTPWILAVNKIDTPGVRARVGRSFDELRAPATILVSATTGSGSGDLLDVIVERLPAGEDTDDAEVFDDERELANAPIRVAVLGRPNVGKSSLINAVARDDRRMVSNQPHTTRESEAVAVVFNGTTLTLVDTAGVRRQAKVERGVRRDHGLERASVRQSLATLKSAAVVWLVVDPTTLGGTQDRRLAGLAIEYGKGIVLVATKRDLWTRSADDVETAVRRTFPFLSWTPLVTVSSVTREQIGTLIKATITAATERMKQLDDATCRQFLADTLKGRAPRVAGRRVRVVGLRQTETAAPRFILTVGGDEPPNQSFLDFLASRLRAQFGFAGTPIRVVAELEKKKRGTRGKGSGIREEN